MTGQSRAAREGEAVREEGGEEGGEGGVGRKKEGGEKVDTCKLVHSCALYVAMKIHETVLEAECSLGRNYRQRCGLDGC